VLAINGAIAFETRRIQGLDGAFENRPVIVRLSRRIAPDGVDGP